MDAIENPFPEPVEIEITDSFDLHSFSPKDIRAVTEAYLAEAHKKGFATVRIIAHSNHSTCIVNTISSIRFIVRQQID